MNKWIQTAVVRPQKCSANPLCHNTDEKEFSLVFIKFFPFFAGDTILLSRKAVGLQRKTNTFFIQVVDDFA